MNTGKNVNIYDIESVSLRFIGKNKKLIITAVVIILLFMAVNLCIEINYAYKLSKVTNIVPEYRLDKFYYNYLSYREQLLYKNIAGAIDTCAEYSETLPYRYTVNEFNRVVKYLLADNPEYFYVNASSAELLSTRNKSRIQLTYLNTPEEIEDMRIELNMALDAAKMSVDENSDEFEREIALHDYLIQNCTFADINQVKSDFLNTAYGALVMGKAYSDGYAMALKMLYDANNIFSLVVYGTANNQPHVWNMVYIGQRFYHVDASWNDADLPFESELMFHGYFNLSDDMIWRDHKPEDKSILPSAGENKTYYHINETYIDNLVSLERIVNRELLEAGYAKRNYIELYLDLEDDVDYYEIIINVIKRINNLQNDFKLMPVYRDYNASYTNNAMTLRVFYENE
ncbi:MAG: transglutaminase domain-containing protein [Eubacteriales bacterium]|nr:transglutaminase domain-containing protein [Eubacteriales bacterium]